MQTNFVAPSQKKTSGDHRFSLSSSSWWADALLRFFEGRNFNPFLETGYGYYRRKRVLDVSISPGRVTAKVQEEQPTFVQVQFTLHQFSNKQWDIIFLELSKKAFFLAKLLANELPPEIEEAFQAADARFIPSSSSELKVTCSCQRKLLESSENKKLGGGCAHSAALYFKFCEQISSDPFLFFLLHGRGREETLAQIRRLRKQNQTNIEERSLDSLGHHQESPSPAADISAEHFWQAGKKLWELSYTIKADELPAAILKRLDPLAYGGMESEIDHLLEEAYTQITRRAQAFGLGLTRVRARP